MVTSSERADAGFTLIELMVAIALGLVLFVFVMQMFMASVASFQATREQSLMQENGRFAATALRRAISSADAWGCVGARGQITDTAGLINPNNAPLTGTENAPPNSDTLRIRSGTTWQQTTLSTLANDGGGALSVNDPNSVQGNIVLVSDCVSGSIVELDASGNSNISTGALRHPEGQYDAGSRVAQAHNTQFTVGLSAGQRCLQRTRTRGNQQQTRDLLCGIEQIHFRYGQVTDGNNSPDIYRRANSVNNWANVVAVRAAIVVRSRNNVDAASSNYRVFDQQYTTTATQSTIDIDGRSRRVVTITVPVRSRMY
jgi:type IV pilus assembly protein PilW